MIRSLRGLGLALLAVFALTAVAASAASAAEFHTTAAPANIEAKATANQVFTVGGGKVATSCNEATFTGTSAAKTVSSLTVHPVYKNSGKAECPAEPIGNATIETTGCNYKFGSATTASGMAEVNIECEASKSIKINAPLCTITVAGQSLPNAVSYTNTGAGKGASSTEGVTVTPTVTGIHWSASGFGCTLVGLGSSGTDGTYTGTALSKAFSGGLQIAAWYE
jgi:hypothetical protein